jgi:acyl-CoA synthetase (AMP-forming)/AMP-acid ligase II
MNIATLLEAIAAIYPDRIAFSDGRDEVSYAELERRSDAWSSWIAEDRRGPVLYVGTNSGSLIEMLFAAAKAGVPFIPVNFRVGQPEYQHFIKVAQPSIIFCDKRYTEEMGNALRAVGSTAVLLENPAAPTTQPRASGSGWGSDPVAVKLFTSGTTAEPKLVNLLHSNLSGYVLETVAAASATDAEAQLLSAPGYHIAAIANILTSVFRGRRLVLLTQFSAAGWLDVVRQQRVTHAMVVPTMLSRILDELDRRKEEFPPSVQSLAYGGSKASRALVDRLMGVIPEGVGLVNAFGLTETSSTVSMLTPVDHQMAWRSDDPDIRERLYSVGRPLPGVQLKVVDDDGAALHRGQKGEIRVRGRQVVQSYAHGKVNLDAEGWLRTGDIGYVDEAGYLFISGRQDDLIIRGGENVSPQEIEDVVREYPQVRDCIILGLEDAEWGEVVGGLIECAAGSVDADELRDWLRTRLAHYKVPTRVRLVEELPRNDMGKVLRRQARELLAEV